MLQIIPVGLAAGAASALLFASMASGSLLAIPLFYLAPLPIYIAGLGWSHLAALIAALVAATGLAAAIGGLFFFLSFLVAIGLPAWWLGYLALLARPTSGAAPGALEWYPVGRIVLWAVVVAVLLVCLGMLTIGTDAESFRAGMRGALERLLGIKADTPPRPSFTIPGFGALDAVDLLVLVAPPSAAVAALLTNLVALWLAARVVKVSGRLRRPWPDLAATSFPPFAPVLLAGTIAATFLPSLVGIMAGVLGATLLMAYGLLGLAVLHALTRGMSARWFILGSLYGAVFVFGWPMLLMSLLGLTDAALGLRGRAAGKNKPPTLRA